MNKFNIILKHLISLCFAIVFMMIAILFIFIFDGAFSQSQSQGREVFRVGVIDTGLDINDPRLSKDLCPYGHKDFTGEGLKDYMGHGTHVVGLIEKYAQNSDYCIIVFKYYSKYMSVTDTVKAYRSALKAAIDMNVKVINYSGGGSQIDWQEMILIKTNPQITFIVSAGNQGRDLEKYPFYPASYDFKNLVSVGALDEIEEHRAVFSNFGSGIKAWETGQNVLSTLPGTDMGYMSGTSQATALETGKWIKEKRSY